jgi:MFS family permease
MTVSLLGDGLYVVAIAWQAYQISNSPYALAVTGVAWTLPTVLVLPVSGALSDRVGRRPLMIVADLLRAGAVGGLALLAVLGTIEVWHLIVLSVVFGSGEALFNPSFVALVPELVPEPLLVKANSLDQAMRPLAMQFLGPALGGVLVASVGTGTAFALDAARTCSRP